MLAHPSAWAPSSSSADSSFAWSSLFLLLWVLCLIYTIYPYYIVSPDHQCLSSPKGRCFGLPKNILLPFNKLPPCPACSLYFSYAAHLKLNIFISSISTLISHYAIFTSYILFEQYCHMRLKYFSRSPSD
jgi:hypothetical protein